MQGPAPGATLGSAIAGAVADVREEFRARRTRVLLTWGGVAWGVFATIALLAFGNGLEAHMRKTAEGMGDAVIVAWPLRTARTWRGLPAGRRVRVAPEDAAAIAALMDASRASDARRTAARAAFSLLT